MTSARIICGDVRAVLPTLADASVQCAVTSPPYWGLRDYGIPPSVWGGRPACAHEWGGALPPKPGRGNRPGDFSTSSLTNPQRQDVLPRAKDSGAFCSACGAWRGCLGLEPTYQLYVEHMVEVFREARRVLRADGTLWLNLGDCYANDGKWGGETGGKQAYLPDADRMRVGRDKRLTGLKPKDLVGIPWRIAFALQADGWYLRSDCIWAKPNPMPESVTDRPTKAHEYLFLLTKSERYFYDADAILEPLAEASAARYLYAFGGAKNEALKAGDNPTAVVGMRDVTDGRNKRTVWTIATQPYSGAHFAVMPEALAEPCILAGTSEKGACAKCGAPWARDVAVDGDTARDRANERGFSEKADGARVFTPQGLNYAGGHGGNARERRTVGWSSSCDCGEQETRPCVVLDPFAGSGTVGVVALKRGRSFLGVELNPKYAAMARDRIHDDAPLLNVVDAPRAGVVPPTPRASPPGGEEDTRCA